EDNLAQVRVGFIVFPQLDAGHVSTRSYRVVPLRRSGQTAAGTHTGHARVANERDGTIGDDSDPGQQTDELPYLSSVYFAAGKDICAGGDADHFWLDVPGSLEQLLVQGCGLDLSAPDRDPEHGVLAGERNNMEPVSDHIGKRGAVMLQDGGKPDVEHFLVVFGIDENCWTRFRHCAEPIASQHV